MPGDLFVICASRDEWTAFKIIGRTSLQGSLVYLMTTTILHSGNAPSTLFLRTRRILLRTQQRVLQLSPKSDVALTGHGHIRVGGLQMVGSLGRLDTMVSADQNSTGQSALIGKRPVTVGVIVTTRCHRKQNRNGCHLLSRFHRVQCNIDKPRYRRFGCLVRL